MELEQANQPRPLIGRSLMSQVERDAILSLIPSQGRFLEIGTFEGKTCAYLAIQRPHVSFLSLDTFGSGWSTPTGRIDLYMQNRLPNMNLFVGTFAQYLAPHPAPSCVWDVILVDGSHDYESVRSDLRNAVKLIKFGSGRILAHDFDAHPDHSGVQRAVTEFCAEHAWKIAGTYHTLAVLVPAATVVRYEIRGRFSMENSVHCQT